MKNYRDDRQQTGHDVPSVSAFDQFVRAVTSLESDQLSCAECRQHFPALYEAEQQTLEISPDLALAFDHLKQCPYCPLEYQALCQAIAALETGTLPELDNIPEFDLSFMEPAPPILSLWRSDAAKQIYGLFTDLLVAVKSTTASFGPLPAPLEPKLAALGAFRSPASTGEPTGKVEVLVLPAPEADLSIQLSVGPVTEGNAAIAVKLLAMDSNTPLSETRVALRNAQHQLLAGALTGHDGSIIFERLLTGRYFIQVRHKNQNWEIPLVLVEGDPSSSTAASTM